MKLISKINRSYLKYGILLFLIADFLLILLIIHITEVDTKQDLKTASNEIKKIIRNHGSIPDIQPFLSVEVLPDSVSVEGIYSDTVIFDSADNDRDNFMEYKSSSKINGVNYLVTYREHHPRIKTYFTLVTTLISSFFLVVILAMLLFIRSINQQIFLTFKENLTRLKSFSFTSKNKLELSETNIDEFDDLNQVLLKMSDRLGKDYQASKEFAANAAHELQTPLAIILNKCEALFSNTALPSETIESIREIYVSTDRLSGITSSLLLLAKIDHGQFDKEEKICLKEIIGERIIFFQEIIDIKGLIIKLNAEKNCTLFLDNRLAILWIQNILINAIKHSPDGSALEIQLTKTHLSISNCGEKAIEHPEQIFNRFYKESSISDSTGIGLAIVKKITDHYHIEIEYTFKDFKHTFTFQFPLS